MAGLRPSGSKSLERCACLRPSGTRNQASGTSSVRYEVAQKESMSLSVRYEESRRQDFVRPVQSHTKGKFVLFHPVRGIKQVELRPVRSHTRGASPRPSITRNQACGTSSARYEVARNESLSSSVWYQESHGRDFVRLVRSRTKRGLVHVLLYTKSSKRDFVRPVRSRTKREHVLVQLVCGINLAGLHPSGTKLCEMKA